MGLSLYSFAMVRNYQQNLGGDINHCAPQVLLCTNIITGTAYSIIKYVASERIIHEMAIGQFLSTEIVSSYEIDQTHSITMCSYTIMLNPIYG